MSLRTGESDLQGRQSYEAWINYNLRQLTCRLSNNVRVQSWSKNRECRDGFRIRYLPRTLKQWLKMYLNEWCWLKKSVLVERRGVRSFVTKEGGITVSIFVRDGHGRGCDLPGCIVLTVANSERVVSAIHWFLCVYIVVHLFPCSSTQIWENCNSLNSPIQLHAPLHA